MLHRQVGGNVPEASVLGLIPPGTAPNAELLGRFLLAARENLPFRRAPRAGNEAPAGR